jgi:hypothetical protein
MANSPRTFLGIASVVYLQAGLSFLFIPGPVMSIYGVSLAAGGLLMTRILGAALIGFAVLFWKVRTSELSPAIRSILLASFLYNLLDLPIVTAATVTGVMSSVGWFAVALHVFLAVGFGYYGFRRVAG